MYLSLANYFKLYFVLGCLAFPFSIQAQKTVIKADLTNNLHSINPSIYGVNQRWFDYNVSLWNDENSKLYKNYRDIGLRSFRYPAETAADAFELPMLPIWLNT